MQTIETELLATVVGGESFGQAIRAANAQPDVPLAQTGAQTTQFIAQHPFFHQGLMNAPIGGGKHFRNVPFVGPWRTLKGAVTGNADGVAKGIAVTHATWDAA